MDRKISRRDFLNGVAIGIGGLLAADPLMAAFAANEFAPEKAPGYYPPALTGMRGNHDGSFPVAHRVRDGEAWEADGAPLQTGELYDLVVGRGGLTGLPAPPVCRRSTGPKPRLL